MAKLLILDSPEVGKLERLIEEATRSTEEGVRRFVEPASGTLGRAVSRQHHLVFGRRGSGKSSLLRKATADLTVDRDPLRSSTWNRSRVTLTPTFSLAF